MPVLFKEKHDCCGCTACVSICPTSALSMKSDEEGFEYPHVDGTSCLNCGLCQKVCAFQSGPFYEAVPGTSLAYAAKHRSDRVRMQSSSGGMFTALADHFLKGNGVIYGAAYDERIVCRHVRATTKEEYAPCMGSKYVQSDVCGVFQLVKQDLASGTEVLFSGTPCQVAGLNAFLGEGSNTKNLLTVDFICHGVPSPRLFEDYVRYHEEKRKKRIVEYYNRCKDRGWGHTEKAVYEDGDFDLTSSLSQSWKYVFYSNAALRPACYRCPYAQEKRFSDITMADFWGAPRVVPGFADDKGISLVLFNTQKGKGYRVLLKNDMAFLESSLEVSLPAQGNLRRPSMVEPGKRQQFWIDYHDRGISYVLKRYGKNSFRGKVKQYVTDKNRWFAPLVEDIFHMKKRLIAK